MLNNASKISKIVKSLVIVSVFVGNSLFALVGPASIILQNNYVKIGISNNSTLGVNASIKPGIQYDPTGTGTADSGVTVNASSYK